MITKRLLKWALSNPDRAAFFAPYFAPLLGWLRKRKALRAFYEACEKEDYRKLLEARAGIKDPFAAIRTFEQFRQRVPLMRKRDILAFDLRRRNVTEGHRITATSGTSGRRLTISRFPEQDEFLPVLMLATSERFFQISRRRIVTLNALALGRSFAGGVMFGTYAAEIGKELPVVVDDCGNEVDAILASLSEPLYREADEFILATYPPKAKEVVEEIRRRGLDLSQLPRINLVLGGQGFSEEERDLLAQGLKIDPDLSSSGKIVGAYALTETIDGGGQESIASIALKRLAWRNPELAVALFGAPKISKFGLYPTGSPAILIEEVDGEIVFTVFDSDPRLVRYATGDLGALFDGKKLLETCASLGYDLGKVLLDQGYSPKVARRELTFLKHSQLVLVKGRKGGIIVCGANIPLSFVEEAVEKAGLKRYIREILLLDPLDEEGFEYPLAAILLKEGEEVPPEFAERCRREIEDFLFAALTDYKVECQSAQREGRFRVRVKLFSDYSDQDPASPFTREKVKMT